MRIEHFNLRVYGILVRNEAVLLVDEIIQDDVYTKFPGGGLEYGEGPVDCLHREALEELGQEVEIIDHFYTTDFFQQSAFKKNDQVISIYYRMALEQPPAFEAFPERLSKEDLLEREEQLAFRWKPLADLSVEDVNFRIDRVAVERLLEEER